MNQNLIQKIREAFPIAPFVAEFTGGLTPTQGNWFIGRCPFHQDPDDKKTKRKFWVNSEKGICGCFVPRCQANQPPMDVINFYARLKNISNNQAIYELSEAIKKKQDPVPIRPFNPKEPSERQICLIVSEVLGICPRNLQEKIKSGELSKKQVCEIFNKNTGFEVARLSRNR